MKVFGAKKFFPIRLVTASANCLVYGLTNQSVTLKKWTFQADCKHKYTNFLSNVIRVKMSGWSQTRPLFWQWAFVPPGSHNPRIWGKPSRSDTGRSWLICNGNFSALLWLSYNGAAIQAVNKIQQTRSQCEPWTDSNELSNNYQVISLGLSRIFKSFGFGSTSSSDLNSHLFD